MTVIKVWWPFPAGLVKTLSQVHATALSETAFHVEGLLRLAVLLLYQHPFLTNSMSTSLLSGCIYFFLIEYCCTFELNSNIICVLFITPR